MKLHEDLVSERGKAFGATGQAVLFSYGSNGPDQLADRLGHDVYAVAAYAENVRRVYRGWSRRWNGGPASMIPRRGSTVYGSAATLSKADVHALAVHEGVHSGSYRLVSIPAMIDTERGYVRKAAVAFISNSDEWNKPSRVYLEAIAANVGAFWHGRIRLKADDFYNED